VSTRRECRPAAVRHVEILAISAREDPVSTDAGVNEIESLELHGIDYIHSILLHVRDVELRAVGRGADVLRHRGHAHERGEAGRSRRLLALNQTHDWRWDEIDPRLRVERQVPDHFARREVDLHHLPRKLTRRDRIAVVGRELHVVEALTRNGQSHLQLHRLWIAEIDVPPRLRDHHRVLAVRREVEVVRIVDTHRVAFEAGSWIDGRESTAPVVGNPQRLQIVRWHDVLRQFARHERTDDLVGAGVDDADGAGARVRNVDQRTSTSRFGREVVRARVRVDVDAVSGRPSGRGVAHARLGLVVAGGKRTDTHQRKNLVHDFQQLDSAASTPQGHDYREITESGMSSFQLSRNRALPRRFRLDAAILFCAYGNRLRQLGLRSTRAPKANVWSRPQCRVGIAVANSEIHDTGPITAATNRVANVCRL